MIVGGYWAYKKYKKQRATKVEEKSAARQQEIRNAIQTELGRHRSLNPTSSDTDITTTNTTNTINTTSAARLTASITYTQHSSAPAPQSVVPQQQVPPPQQPRTESQGHWIWVPDPGASKTPIGQPPPGHPALMSPSLYSDHGDDEEDYDDDEISPPGYTPLAATGAPSFPSDHDYSSSTIENSTATTNATQFVELEDHHAAPLIAELPAGGTEVMEIDGREVGRPPSGSRFSVGSRYAWRGEGEEGEEGDERGSGSDEEGEESVGATERSLV